MPSAFTHALVGGTLGAVGVDTIPRKRLALTCAVLAVLPDADVIMFQFGIPYGHPLGHRGITHSLAYALLIGAVTARLVFPTTKESARSFLTVTLLLFLSTASHGLLDAITDAGRGVGFFIPFDNTRYFFPWRPIVTSSVDPIAFFTERAWVVLRSEFRIVWLPLLAMASTVAGVRYVLRSRSLVRR